MDEDYTGKRNNNYLALAYIHKSQVILKCTTQTNFEKKLYIIVVKSQKLIVFVILFRK